MKLSPAIRKWYRRIGTLGGAAGKGTPLRRQLNRQNIRIRWSAVRKAARAERRELRKLLGRIPIK
jgi:hypothetical protein